MLSKLFYVLICFIAMQPLQVFAQGYEIKIGQVEPQGEVSLTECKQKMTVCNISLPILHGKEIENMTVDVTYDADHIYFQFLWKGNYLFWSKQNKGLYTVGADISEKEIKRISVYIPSELEKDDQPEFAVHRIGSEVIVNLEITVIALRQ